MDKYNKHRFFTALVLEIRASLYLTPSDAISPCLIACVGAHFQVCRFCGLVCGTCKVFKFASKFF